MNEYTQLTPSFLLWYAYLGMSFGGNHEKFLVICSLPPKQIPIETSQKNY